VRTGLPSILPHMPGTCKRGERHPERCACLARGSACQVRSGISEAQQRACMAHAWAYQAHQWACCARPCVRFADLGVREAQPSASQVLSSVCYVPCAAERAGSVASQAHYGGGLGGRGMSGVTIWRGTAGADPAQTEDAGSRTVVGASWHHPRDWGLRKRRRGSGASATRTQVVANEVHGVVAV